MDKVELSPGKKTRLDVTRKELEKLIFPKGKLPAWAKAQLDRGCIGLCALYQGYDFS
jgi:hypothetical protein